MTERRKSVNYAARIASGRREFGFINLITY